MNRGIIHSSRKFRKRRKHGDEDSEFCIGYDKFKILVVHPGAGVQKAVGDNEKEARDGGKDLAVINTRRYFSKYLKHVTGGTQRF